VRQLPNGLLSRVELSPSVHEIARRVAESSKIAREAVIQASKTDARIGELSHAAGRIGGVVKLITAMSRPTCSREAARAGEAGRGFAVVANEVKALAAQTARATGEIRSEIAGMRTATQDSVSAIKEIGGTIKRISEIASAIAAAVEEQGAASQEISGNVQQAAKGTANIGHVNNGAGQDRLGLEPGPLGLVPRAGPARPTGHSESWRADRDPTRADHGAPGGCLLLASSRP
jgi:methyl-accepting chemotaxis protein